MKIIFFMISVLIFSVHADAKEPVRALQFSIDGKVVMTVRTLKEVKLSSEPMPVVSEVEPKSDKGIQEVKTKPDPSKKLWDVGFTLNQKDAEQFKSLTENNIGKKLSISANGKTLLSSSINAGIPSGMGNIVIPNEKEAKRLFKSLKSIESRK